MTDAATTAAATAALVRSRAVSARSAVDAALARIAAHNGALNAFTAVTAERARVAADAVDARIARGEDPGPLAGVPFAVKNLFDVANLPTLAGSKINAEHPPAARDAAAVRRLEAAGAVLVGTLNMGEYAYDFTGRNAHYGPSRNPHDLDRIPGGSSGGSGSAVGGGLVPLALGSDTNGSIRVPAALCGLFGLKPTYGRLSRAGAFLFAASFDHVGPLARSAADLAASYDAMQGPDPEDPACAGRPVDLALPALATGIGDLRIAVAGGYFASGGAPEVHAAVARVADALKATRTVELPEAPRARAAGFVITSVDGSNLHWERLKTHAADYDPETRDRFLAGLLVPGNWYVQAQRFRRWFHRAALAAFRETDIILAPVTPVPAPRIDQQTMSPAGIEMPVRANLGIFTQPLSFIGLPVVAVPVQRPGALPVGVQVVAAPWREADALRVAAALEADGVAAALVPERFA
ncbi:MAG: AtzE family amidohydrolase [Rhodospirillales bacterium]